MSEYANYTPGPYAAENIRITPTTLADGRDFFYLDDDPEYVSGAKTRELNDPRQLAYRFANQLNAAGEEVPIADVAASFQEAVTDVLTRKAVKACRDNGVDHLMIGGGVAANSRLREMAQQRCDRAGIRLRVPRPGLCTDNGAMVAALGSEMVWRGRTPSAFDLSADSSLPVTDVHVPHTDFHGQAYDALGGGA